MKKLISAIAALGLVAGVATAASAYEISLKGNFWLEGYHLSNGDANGFTATKDQASNSWWVQTVMLDPTIKVNDKITLYTQARFAKERDWGVNDTTSAATTDGQIMQMYYAYMTYDSPIGAFKMGRTPAGAWFDPWFNTTGNANRLYYTPNMIPKPFSLTVYLSKNTEDDYNDATVSDQDYDSYYAGLTYKTDTLTAALGFDFYNNKTVATQQAQFTRVKGYVMADLGGVSVVGEFSKVDGDVADYDGATADTDRDTFAIMLGASTKIDNMKVSGTYFYASGDDNTGDNTNEAAMSADSDGVGDDYNPLYVLTGDHTGLMNSDEYAADANIKAAGAHAIILAVDMPVSDKLTLHGALGYAMADKEMAGWDDSYGWEVDLGAKYALMDNLTYEVRAGYLDVGDFFTEANTVSIESSLYLLSHHLIMKF
jgi:hypothetical protein